MPFETYGLLTSVEARSSAVISPSIWGGQIFFRGVYSEGQLDLLSDIMPKHGVFVDIGANHGEFVICAAAALRAERVYAFEPMAGNIKRLESNVRANRLSNVEIIACGLSNKSAEDMPIYSNIDDFQDGTLHAGLGTLYDIQGRSVEIERISLCKLDDIFPEYSKIDVIKIDVEGAELSALFGAEETIQRTRPFVIFEANRETSRAAGYALEDLLNWFEVRDYTLKRIGPKGEQLEVDSDLGFSNIVAIPE
jgi:FkbM family methyltransferase